MEPRYSIDLGHEELVVLLWLLRAPTLPGLGPDPLVGLRGDSAAAALSAAERALRARGILEAGAKGPVLLDQGVAALVGTCVTPDVTVLVATVGLNGGPSLRYLFATDLLTVEHTNHEPGIHRFAALGKRPALARRLRELLDLDGREAPAAAPVEIPEAELRRIAERLGSAARQTGDQFLAGATLDPATAAALTEALEGASRSCLVTARRGQRSKQPAGETIVLLQSGEGMWELEGVMHASVPHVGFRPISGAKVETRLKGMVGV